MRPIVLATFFLLFGPLVFAQTDTREQRLLDHARYCLVNDLIVGGLKTGSNVELGRVPCRAGELGLAFIGEKSSQSADRELAKLRRYVLDAALGESYSCYVLNRGARVLALIKSQDRRQERSACETEL